MEATMHYGNTVLEWPKQLAVGDKGEYCCILVCKSLAENKHSVV